MTKVTPLNSYPNVSPARTAVAQLTRIYAEPLLACVADNRKMMRDAAIAALDKVTTVGGEGKLHHSSVVTLGSCSSNLVLQVRPGGIPSFLPCWE